MKCKICQKPLFGSNKLIRLEGVWSGGQSIQLEVICKHCDSTTYIYYSNPEVDSVWVKDTQVHFAHERSSNA